MRAVYVCVWIRITWRTLYRSSCHQIDFSLFSSLYLSLSAIWFYIDVTVSVYLLFYFVLRLVASRVCMKILVFHTLSAQHNCSLKCHSVHKMFLFQSIQISQKLMFYAPENIATKEEKIVFYFECEPRCNVHVAMTTNRGTQW